MSSFSLLYTLGQLSLKKMTDSVNYHSATCTVRQLNSSLPLQVKRKDKIRQVLCVRNSEYAKRHRLKFCKQYTIVHYKSSTSKQNCSLFSSEEASNLAFNDDRQSSDCCPSVFGICTRPKIQTVD